MPTYDYKCDVCHKIITHLQKGYDVEQIICPECKVPMKRIFSATHGIVIH